MTFSSLSFNALPMANLIKLSSEASGSARMKRRQAAAVLSGWESVPGEVPVCDWIEGGEGTRCSWAIGAPPTLLCPWRFSIYPIPSAWDSLGGIGILPPTGSNPRTLRPLPLPFGRCWGLRKVGADGSPLLRISLFAFWGPSIGWFEMMSGLASTPIPGVHTWRERLLLRSEHPLCVLLKDATPVCGPVWGFPGSHEWFEVIWSRNDWCNALSYCCPPLGECVSPSLGWDSLGLGTLP